MRDHPCQPLTGYAPLDGAERLTEFVSECGGVLTERGESGGVLQLFLLPRYLLLGLAATPTGRKF